MRLLALSIVCIAATAAADPGAQTMTQLKDPAAACAELAPKATHCKKWQSMPVKGIGTADVYVNPDGDPTYAMVVTANSLSWLSVPLTVKMSTCNKTQCDVIDTPRPSVHVVTINNVQVPVLQIDLAWHHEVTDDKGKKATTDKWTSTQVLACFSGRSGPSCRTYSWGGRGNSCKITIGNDGAVKASCEVTDQISVE